MTCYFIRANKGNRIFESQIQDKDSHVRNQLQMLKEEFATTVDREQFIKTLFQLLLDYATQLQSELHSLLYITEKRENNNNNKSSEMEVEVEHPEEVYQEELNDMQSQLRRIRTVMSIVQKAQKEQQQLHSSNVHHHYISFGGNSSLSDNLQMENNNHVRQANQNDNIKDSHSYNTNKINDINASYEQLSNLTDTISNASSSSLAYLIITNTLRCVRLQMTNDEPICTSTRKGALLLPHVHAKSSRESSSTHDQVHSISKVVSLPEVMLDIYARNTCVHLRRRKRSEHPQTDVRENSKQLLLVNAQVTKKEKTEMSVSTFATNESLPDVIKERVTDGEVYKCRGNASCNLNNNNTNVSVNNKSEEMEKTKEASVAKTSEVQLPFFAHLASLQCGERDDIYTARTPQFPVISLDNNNNKLVNHNSNTTVHSVYISPALRLFTSVNMEAEGKMVMHMCKVKTKLQLLLDVPKLKDEVGHYRSDLETQDLCADRLQSVHNFVSNCSHTIRQGMTDKNKTLLHINNKESFQSDSSATESSEHYFTFPYTNDGVVRVIVQQALVLDVTYDFNVKQWCLLQMQWDLYTTSFGGLNTDHNSLIYEVEETDHEPELANNNECHNDNCTFNANSYNSKRSEQSLMSCGSITQETWNKVIVPHKNVMFRFLHHHFANDGLASGCMAANRLVNTVVMDAVAAQLTELQHSFFVGQLSSLFSLDIRTGTFVAWRLTLLSHTNLQCVYHDKDSTSALQKQEEEEEDDVNASCMPSNTKSKDLIIDKNCYDSNSSNSKEKLNHVENVVMHFKAYITCGMVLCDVIANTNVMNKQTFRILSPLSTSNAKNERVTMTTVSDNCVNTTVHGSVVDVVELVFHYLYEQPNTQKS